MIRQFIFLFEILVQIKLWLYRDYRMIRIYRLKFYNIWYIFLYGVTRAPSWLHPLAWLYIMCKCVLIIRMMYLVQCSNKMTKRKTFTFFTFCEICNYYGSLTLMTPIEFKRRMIIFKLSVFQTQGHHHTQPYVIYSFLIYTLIILALFAF